MTSENKPLLPLPVVPQQNSSSSWFRCPSRNTLLKVGIAGLSIFSLAAGLYYVHQSEEELQTRSSYFGRSFHEFNWTSC